MSANSGIGRRAVLTGAAGFGLTGLAGPAFAPEYLEPGVYIDEIPSSAQPIEGVSTSTAAFVGATQRGPVKPTLISNVMDYRSAFADPDLGLGEAMDRDLLLSAVYTFFLQGGQRAWILPARSAAPADLLGHGEESQGLAFLRDEPDLARAVNLLLIPDAADLARASVEDAVQIYREAAEWAEANRAFLLIDTPVLLEGEPVAGLSAEELDAAWRGRLGIESASAALFAPPLEASGADISVPASAAVAGAIARTDYNDGPFKAAAGMMRGRLSGVRLTRTFSAAEQGVLSPRGVNLIQEFEGGGPVIFGARTLAGPASEFRHIPTKRTFDWIGRSLQTGLAWTVFETNDVTLWKSVRRDGDAFLNGLWRQGALQGAAPDEAFYVRCGLGETMTQQDLDEGRLILETGLALVKPAEFLISRLEFLVGSP